MKINIKELERQIYFHFFSHSHYVSTIFRQLFSSKIPRKNGKKDKTSHLTLKASENNYQRLRIQAKSLKSFMARYARRLKFLFEI